MVPPNEAGYGQCGIYPSGMPDSPVVGEWPTILLIQRIAGSSTVLRVVMPAPAQDDTVISEEE